ncbi:MAG TPA: hypothetical protein K8V56_03480 [Sporosarcina psychrophila]|uniref:Ig-like domain-containing protein n=1 Tax=Sporosarcina psychrophila TaxID=1476 RepID=A0A921FXM1_SPOPS|nr:hypothetical protein [Sporosarcina psychrophila]
MKKIISAIFASTLLFQTALPVFVNAETVYSEGNSGIEEDILENEEYSDEGMPIIHPVMTEQTIFDELFFTEDTFTQALAELPTRLSNEETLAFRLPLKEDIVVPSSEQTVLTFQAESGQKIDLKLIYDESYHAYVLQEDEEYRELTDTFVFTQLHTWTLSGEQWIIAANEVVKNPNLYTLTFIQNEEVEENLNSIIESGTVSSHEGESGKEIEVLLTSSIAASLSNVQMTFLERSTKEKLTITMTVSEDERALAGAFVVPSIEGGQWIPYELSYEVVENEVIAKLFEDYLVNELTIEQIHTPQLIGFELEEQKVVLQVGEKKALPKPISVLDENFPLDTISYSTNAPIIKVSDDSFEAVSAGTAILYVTLGEITKEMVVEVLPDITYSTHIESFGWEKTAKKNGEMSGTSGLAKRLEAVEISIPNNSYKGNIEYQTHVQSYGWMDWKKNGEESGTSGQAKRLEGIRIKLTGELASQYDVYYRVHAQSYGWLGWAKNGQEAGTEGLSKRLEAIEIRLVEKDSPAPGKTDKAYLKSDASVSYTTHVQKQGWQNYVFDGEMSGTSGEALRLEALKMTVSDAIYSGGIEYRTHIQKEGWQDWKSNNQLSGTEGKALRLEAVEMRLTGELAKHYDIYYRVHAQSFGWLDWAKNGEEAGTEGLAKRLEGLEVQLVKKGSPAPGSTKRPFVLSTPKVNYTTYVQKEGWKPTVSNGAMSGTTGKGLRLEALLMNVHTQSLTGTIEHRAHVQKEGWQDWHQGWTKTGTTGKGLRMEAVQIKLTDEMAKYYYVYYRVHAQSYGWLGWAKSGQSAGTEGFGKRLEGIQIKLVLKGNKAPGSTANAFIKK